MLTLKYLNSYEEFLQGEGLFLCSLGQNNNEFIKNSLLMGSYDKQIFKKEEVIVNIIEFMK